MQTRPQRFYYAALTAFSLEVVLNVKVGHELLGAYITDIQNITIAVSAVLFVAVLLLLHKTRLGKPGSQL